MICSRCGSEFVNKENICPRCGNGRPKARKKLPKWVGWSVMGLLLVSLVGLVVGLVVQHNAANRWMTGVWQEDTFSLTLNAQSDTFYLTDEGVQITGTFAVVDNTLGLTSSEGGLYIYRFERMSNRMMRLRFSQNDTTETLTVTKITDKVSDFAVMPGLGEPNELPDIEQVPQPDDTPTVEPLPNPSQPDTQTPQQPDQPTPPVQNDPQPAPDDLPVQEVINTYGVPYGYDEDKLNQPKLFLFTERNKEITDRENYLDATVTLADAGEYGFSDYAARVRGRGNSTWLHFDKKPYRLKFNEKVDLLGMGANKDWVLLSNAFDETMLRYYLAFSLAHELGLEYTGEYQFINLYINGEYRGLYLLTEQIEEGNSRVDVNSSKTGEVDTGYLLEGIGNNTKVEEERFFTVPEVNGQRLDPKKPEFRFYVKSPDETECTDAQLAYIEDYVLRVNEAILTKDWETINKLVDVESAAKMFLLDQVMLNNDMGYCFYLYKKAGGKLCFGPMWDYDQSCGGSSWGGPTYRGWETGTSHTWYLALIEIPEFQDLVRGLYKEHRDFIEKMPEFAEATYIQHKYDFNMNNEKWVEMFGNTKKFRRMPELMYLENYSQHLNYLQAWLRNRARWIRSELNIG